MVKRPDQQYVSTMYVGWAVVMALVGQDGTTNIVGQWEQNRVVVLEARASIVLEQPIADLFTDSSYLISVAAEGLR